MSNNKPETFSSQASSKLDRKSRLSLPEKEKRNGDPSDQPRRNTFSEYSSKVKKKIKAPSAPAIPEDEVGSVETPPFKTEDYLVEDEIKKTLKVNRNPSSASKSSATSKVSKVSYVYDNTAYEGTLKRTGSGGTNSTSKQPSLQSLEVYQEQYCCFSKRTKFEKYLLIIVTILLIIIIVLVIVIIVLAKHINNPEDDQLFSSW